MNQAESIEEFYKRIKVVDQPVPIPTVNSGLGHFNIFERNAISVKTPYSRRDFYKISFVIGTGTLYYADKWIHIDRPALLFSNPAVPYSWEPESAKQEGWFCLFTKTFIQAGERSGILQESPLFRIGSNPIFFMNQQQQADIGDIFRKMLKEIGSEYDYKYEVLRNYLHLIIHEAMKMEPGKRFEKLRNASSRVCGLFLELLERQFPIDNPHMQLKLKTAADYSQSLSVHVNHLNRSVKAITGKTTTQHIAARIVQEASALLQHTDWTISEIAYSLGFEYPAYFTNFLRKMTGCSPNELRNALV